MKIVIDTSGIIECVRAKVDLRDLVLRVNERVEFVVPSGVLSELRFLSKNKGKRGRNAKAALLVLENIEYDVVESKENVDDFIVNYAITNKAAVLTNDKKLRSRLLAKGLIVFSVKGFGYVDRV